MHTVAENPNSIVGVAKVCTASSGSTSTHFELSHSLESTEPSSAGKTVHLMKKKLTMLVSPADSKHDSAKHSEESSQELARCSEKVSLKGSQPSVPKSSQASRTYMSSGKHRLPVLKEQSQKTATTGGTPARLFHVEVVPLHSRNKAMPSSFSQKRDKTNHRFIHITQEGSNNSTSTELRASGTTVSLSDEQLALLLHQQLNSSPRVPRVLRCHQASSMQMLHPTGATIFSKRSPAHGGRDQTLVLKKRNKDDALRDNDDTKKRGKHWRDLSKPNGEDYAYSNCLHAVNDCLRNRSDWAHLVGQAPKMNPSKRRKVESDSLLADALETEKMRNVVEWDPEDGSAESHQEDLPRGKQKTRKCRRLELKGRRVKGTRKRSSVYSSSEDAAATLSDFSSDRNDNPHGC